MTDVFISYVRSAATEAEAIAEALREAGYAVWRDDQLPAHRPYSEVIEERLRQAKAVVTIWSADAVRSDWVRAEADFARKGGVLVQLTPDGTTPPLPFDQIQCVDLSAWRGDRSSHAWQVVLGSVAELCRQSPAAIPRAPQVVAPPSKATVAVLPFDNRSDDPEQAYFSDGVAEDVITDLAKVSALRVVGRKSAFALRDQAMGAVETAHRLGATHVVVGSVRKAGGRVRITAALLDGLNGEQLWGERFDREMEDIFALQDEISHAIVAALRLKLLPHERRALEQRGTTDVEAFNLYLMARQRFISDNMTDPDKAEAVIRLCQRAVDLDPRYARAWAQMAIAQRMATYSGGSGDSGLIAAERALALDSTLAEAHAARAGALVTHGRFDEARQEVEAALSLDASSHEANQAAGKLCFAQGRAREAIPFWEKAAAVAEDEFSALGMLMTCYSVIGDPERARDAARRTLVVTERMVERDPTNGSAISMLVGALALLGEAERAKRWIERALLVDPANLNMRYNLACALILDLNAPQEGLDLLGPALAGFSKDRLDHARVDPDLDPVRDDPRFQAMLAAADDRLAQTGFSAGS